MQKKKRYPEKKRFGVGALLSALGCVALLAPACSNDDDGAGNGNDGGSGAGRAGAPGSPGGAGAGGSSAGESPGGYAGGAGSPEGGTSAGEGGTGEGGAAGGSGTAGLGGDDVNVFRPEELPFDQEAFEALTLPEGFGINVYRTGLGQARMLGVYGPHVYVTQPMQGTVIRLIDGDEDGVAEAQAVAASGIPMVHGIAFHDDQVFLANVKSVFHGTVAADGTFGPLTEIIDDLPDGGQHPLRTLGVGPDELLYISVGSTCDACQETNPEHATLLTSTLAGQPAAERTILATGLRNTIGFGWHPVTDVLWGMDHGSDWRGDDLPPEELNAITAGTNYGWPYCYGNRQIDPVIQDPPGQTKESYCAATEPPVLLNQAHQAPIGMVFYTGATFPAEYQNGAFVAFRGSWNRKPPTGYYVGFVSFEDGDPQEIRDFVSGFLIDDGTATFGRPAGIAVAADGALLFTDDTNGIVYRVQYE